MNHRWLILADHSSFYPHTVCIIRTRIHLRFSSLAPVLVSLDVPLTLLFSGKHCYLFFLRVFQTKRRLILRLICIYLLLLILKQDDTLIKAPVKARISSHTHRCFIREKKHKKMQHASRNHITFIWARVLCCAVSCVSLIKYISSADIRKVQVQDQV